MCKYLRVCMCTIYVQETGVRSPGTGVTDDWEPPCECWEPIPSPLYEQQVLMTTEPSLQSPPYLLSRKSKHLWVIFLCIMVVFQSQDRSLSMASISSGNFAGNIDDNFADSFESVLSWTWNLAFSSGKTRVNITLMLT